MCGHRRTANDFAVKVIVPNARYRTDIRPKLMLTWKP
jgi:hypothetical protein